MALWYRDVSTSQPERALRQKQHEHEGAAGNRCSSEKGGRKRVGIDVHHRGVLRRRQTHDVIEVLVTSGSIMPRHASAW